ncbi:MAG: lytic transglycosylase domain-containing protein, partial [Deltaproteobacteria bacterium]
MTSVDPPVASGQLDFVGALLVADTRAFVSEWRQWVAAGAAESEADSAREDDPIVELRERSKTLQLRARAAGVGGLAHHLAMGEECLQRECDRDRLQDCQANILELAGQLEQEIELQRAPAPVVSSVESEAAEGPATERASVSTGAVELVSGPQPAIPVASAWRGWKRLSAGAEPSLDVAHAEVAEDGATALSQVLGLTPIGATAAAGAPAALADAPGGSLPAEAAELLPAEFVVDDEDDDELTDQDLEIRLDFSRRTGSHRLLLSQHEVAIELPPRTVPPFRRRARTSRRVYWLALLDLGVLGGVVALVFTRSGAREAEARADAATATRSGALLPQPRRSGSEKGLYVLLAQAHTYGSSESPQLGQLLDDEAASIAQAMTEPCAPGSLGCALSEQGRLLLEQKPLERPPSGAAAEPAQWLSGLRTPQIGVPADAQIRQQLESHTEDAVGHEMFQALLFQCAAYQDLLQGALRDRNLPLDLAAVVMVESGCAPDAESAVGARGVWQLTRARARAYHLKVQPGVIDERLNAAKATDAALDLLGDLYIKLGSWQLALAGYELGAFNVITRARQLGPSADYAALVSAEQLPGDTLSYVAKVEAFAVILANLEHFHFSAPPARVGSTSAAL